MFIMNFFFEFGLYIINRGKQPHKMFWFAISMPANKDWSWPSEFIGLEPYQRDYCSLLANSVYQFESQKSYLQFLEA
jgi:hypothetical protein